MNKVVDMGVKIAYVHSMNNKSGDQEDYRSLLVLDEISKNDEITQRDLSKKLGIALGLVNSYLKNLVKKGHVTVSTIPRKRYKYYLTPKGFSEKTRLTYHHLQNFTSLYRVARKDFSSLFHHLADSGVKSVAFCGVDEVAEIAFLSLNEVDIQLTGVFDNERVGFDFFGHGIKALNEIMGLVAARIVITSFAGGERVIEELINNGVSEESLIDISKGGWLKKLNANQLPASS
jgi:DNA-binding MarR family transcriptional regulator